MSMIFRDAAVTLQDLRTPQGRPSSNTKKSRLPTSQTRTAMFGNISNGQASSSADGGSPMGTQFGVQKPTPVPGIGNLPDSLSQGAGPDDTPVHGGQKTLAEYSTDLPTLPNQRPSTPPSASSHSLRRAHGCDSAPEHISSGFKSSSALYSQPPNTPEEVVYPEFDHWQLPLSSSIPGSDGGDYIPNRGASLTLSLPSSNTEERHGAKIEDWLDDIYTLINTDEGDPRVIQQQSNGMSHVAVPAIPGIPVATPNKPLKKASKLLAPELSRSPRKTVSVSSNKENISPPKSIPSPTRHLIQHNVTSPSTFRDHKTATQTQSTGTLHFAHPMNPQGHLSVPPKRKRARVSLSAKLESKKSAKDFTIHDEQVAAALAQLSPDVELRRKGRRPKRERCMSYWDEDILMPDSPCLLMEADENVTPMRKGRKVLGESQQTAELTTEKPFVKEAGDAVFDFGGR